MTTHRNERINAGRANARILCVMGLALAWFHMAPHSSQAAMLANGGFEASVSTAGGVPTTQGVWQGDYSQIVFAARGVTPFEGAGMLRFLAARPQSPGRESTGCEVYQMVDLSAYQSLIATGFAAARLTAQFNRVPGDEQTDDLFGIGMYAVENMVAEQNIGTLQNIESGIISDADPTTWESHSLVWTLPAQTVGLYTVIEASENRFNDIWTAEFDGHYADAVTLEVFPAIPGDTNGDGRVDIADLSNVRNNFGQTGDQGLPGDAFPVDGKVNINDLNLVRGNYGRSISQPVPEPTSLTSAAFLILTALMTMRGQVLDSRRRH